METKTKQPFFIHELMSVLKSHQDGRRRKKKPDPSVSFFFLLGCFSPLGAARRNPAIGIVGENTFWENSQFSTVIQQDPREEALVRGGIMS